MRMLDIDIVETDAEPADRLKPRACVKNRAAHLRPVTHDQRAGIAQQIGELLRPIDKPFVVMHGKVAAEIVDNGFIHELADDDIAQSSLPSFPRRCTLIDPPGSVENADESPACGSGASSAMLPKKPGGST